MEQNPAEEAMCPSPNQKIPRILQNPKVSYRDHNSLPLNPILSYINLIHAIPSYICKINIVF
jgi:hypothetical protein